MSFVTGTQSELLFVQPSAGTPLTNSVTKTVISVNSATADPCILPANFALPTYGVNKVLHVRARGVISTDATAPGTLTVGIYPDTAAGTAAATPLLATGAFTPAVSLSNAVWTLEGDIQVTATGSSGTWLALGAMNISPPAAAGASYGAGSSSAVTLSTQSSYFLEVAATWGTALSTNSITCYQFLVYGEN